LQSETTCFLADGPLSTTTVVVALLLVSRLSKWSSGWTPIGRISSQKHLSEQHWGRELDPVSLTKSEPFYILFKKL